MREVKTISVFKNKIKAWTTDKCLCGRSKNYLGQVGFIESCSNYFYRNDIILFDSWSRKKKKIIKLICTVCFHLVKCVLSNCVLLLFHSIFLLFGHN